MRRVEGACGTRRALLWILKPLHASDFRLDALQPVSYRFLARHCDVSVDAAKRCDSPLCLLCAARLDSPSHTHALSPPSALYDFSTTPAAKKCVVTYCIAGWSQV